MLGSLFLLITVIKTNGRMNSFESGARCHRDVTEAKNTQEFGSERPRERKDRPGNEQSRGRGFCLLRTCEEPHSSVGTHPIAQPSDESSSKETQQRT